MMLNRNEEYNELNDIGQEINDFGGSTAKSGTPEAKNLSHSSENPPNEPFSLASEQTPSKITSGNLVATTTTTLAAGAVVGAVAIGAVETAIATLALTFAPKISEGHFGTYVNIKETSISYFGTLEYNMDGTVFVELSDGTTVLSLREYELSSSEGESENQNAPSEEKKADYPYLYSLEGVFNEQGDLGLTFDATYYFDLYYWKNGQRKSLYSATIEMGDGFFAGILGGEVSINANDRAETIEYGANIGYNKKGTLYCELSTEAGTLLATQEFLLEESEDKRLDHGQMPGDSNDSLYLYGDIVTGSFGREDGLSFDFNESYRFDFYHFGPNGKEIVYSQNSLVFLDDYRIENCSWTGEEDSMSLEFRYDLSFLDSGNLAHYLVDPQGNEFLIDEQEIIADPLDMNPDENGYYHTEINCFYQGNYDFEGYAFRVKDKDYGKIYFTSEYNVSTLASFHARLSEPLALAKDDNRLALTVSFELEFSYEESEPSSYGLAGILLCDGSSLDAVLESDEIKCGPENATLVSEQENRYAFSYEKTFYGTMSPSTEYSVWIRIEKPEKTGDYPLDHKTFSLNPEGTITPYIKLKEYETSETGAAAGIYYTSLTYEFAQNGYAEGNGTYVVRAYQNEGGEILSESDLFLSQDGFATAEIVAFSLDSAHGDSRIIEVIALHEGSPTLTISKDTIYF